jgi:hypothetical protein
VGVKFDHWRLADLSRVNAFRNHVPDFEGGCYPRKRPSATVFLPGRSTDLPMIPALSLSARPCYNAGLSGAIAAPSGCQNGRRTWERTANCGFVAQPPTQHRLCNSTRPHCTTSAPPRTGVSLVGLVGNSVDRPADPP